MFCNVPHPPTHLNTFCVLCFIGRTGEGKLKKKKCELQFKAVRFCTKQVPLFLAVMMVLQNGDDKNYYYYKKTPFFWLFCSLMWMWKVVEHLCASPCRRAGPGRDSGG